MDMPTLRQFRYFEALSRTGHFGRAAEECAVTQPALSMQIQEMEKELGVTLVERRRDGVMLTSEGGEILAHVRNVLAEVEAITGYVQNRDGLSGTLRFGVIPTVGPYLLPSLLPELSRQYPELKLQVRETRTATLLEELEQGRVDLIVGALPLEGSDIVSDSLFQDRFLLATPAARPAPPVSAIREYLASEQLLLLEEGHCLRDQALNHCEAAGIRFGEIYGTSNIATLIQMVANGLGITLVPEISLDMEINRARVRLSRFAAPEPYRTIALAWRRSSPRAPFRRNRRRDPAPDGRPGRAGAAGFAGRAGALRHGSSGTGSCRKTELKSS